MSRGIPPALLRKARQQYGSWEWRLNNLYWITDKEGRESICKLNWAQLSLFKSMHYLSLILKARQLGMSTFILVYMLDVCLFQRNIRCGIIDYRLDDAKKKLEKIRFAYERLPAFLKLLCPVRSMSVTKIEFKNGSSIEVGTSHRGGTLQYLHVSEFGKICAKFPDKAREIRTGALNTIQKGQVVWIESTAEGQQGDYFDLCEAAQTKQRLSIKLTPMDFKFSFFPWWKETEYQLEPDGIEIPADLATYFKKIEGQPSFIGSKPAKVPKLTDRQKAWYVKKRETQLEDMKREFPATPREAFEASLEGAILGRHMEAAEYEGRIGKFKALPGVPVHSFWDIGRRDYNSIFFGQILVGPLIRIVGFHQDVMRELPHYVELLLGSEKAAKAFGYMAEQFQLNTKGMYADKGWVQGEAWLPHDGKVTEWGSGRSRIEQAQLAGLKPMMQRDLSLHDGLNAMRSILPYCYFDATDSAVGVRMLKAYRWEWDDIRGAWMTGKPAHDTASHGSDAFRGLATSFTEIKPGAPPKDAEPLRGVENMTVRELLKQYRPHMVGTVVR